MNIKLTIHLMPWEIDYALLSFTQLKKSKYHLPDDVNITIDSVLNLSSYLINWEESKLPKEYFIEKYNQISNLLTDYNHNKKIYDGDKLYGHLDLQRDCKSKDTDYYIGVCPDMYFSEYLLYYMIEGIRNIKDKYFILTPQHRKMSDPSWDPTTAPDCLNIPYSQYNNVDVFDLRVQNQNREDVSIISSPDGKWAGWFDLYSKEFYEDLCPVHDDWSGYGPWDWYSLILVNIAKQNKIDVKRYIVSGQTIGEYWTGDLLENDGFSGYYKKLITKNTTPNQREVFESNMESYIIGGVKMLQNKNII
jgi:hypothetical protein